MKVSKTFHKIQKHLFTPIEKCRGVLSETEIEIKSRYSTIFSLWIEDPTKADALMRKEIMDKFNISKAQAYDDISKVKILLADVQNTSKEFNRYTAITMVKEGYADISTAKKQFEIERGLGKIKAAVALCKIAKLDLSEPDELPFDQIVPASFEATTDPTVLGIKPLVDREAKMRQFREKYNIQDAQIVE